MWAANDAAYDPARPDATDGSRVRRSFDFSRLQTLDASNVCLVKPSAFGDVVQTLPLLPALRERFPGARLSWVVNAGLVDLVAGHPCLDEAIPFDRKAGWAANWQFLRELRRRRFDLVLDLQGLLRSAVMTWATRAPLRLGLETSRECAHLACHATLPGTGKIVPAHERYWRVAEAFGVEGGRRPTTVAFSEDDSRWVTERLRPLPPPYLAVHAGARWATKRWPVERFATVATKAARGHDFSVVLVGGPDERETSRDLARTIERLHPEGRVLDLTGGTSLVQLTALLAEADVMLTNDSGPMHLAAGVGTPVVGVFTCTSAVRSGPPGGEHELVSTHLPCAASYNKRCPHRGNAHQACFDELTAERVWAAFERLVARTPSIRRPLERRHVA